MKQEPLQNLKQRAVRCFLAILALLMMPAGVWAEEYDLWVAGTQVSSDNASDVLGDGKVSWNNSSNTLTLNNATLSGSIEKTATETGEQLIINLVGTNTVNGQISFQSEDRMYLGDLSFTGSGSLNITSNDENGVIDGVSSVNTAEGLYIATDTPDPICYNGYYIAGNSGSVMSLTVSTNVTYPVWVYNTSTTHYTQLTAATSTFTTPEQNADENHSGSVSFSNNTLTLTNFLCKTTENNDFVFYIGKSLKNLAVNLVGESYIHQNSFHYAKLQETEEEPTLTFTTSNNGKLTYESDPEFWGNVTLNYENGLGYYSYVISTDWPRLQIGSTFVRGTASTIGDYSNVSFDDATNTLTLGGVTIGSPAETVTDIDVFIKNLNVEISGTNTVYGRFYGLYEENRYRAGTITFKKKSDAETANLTVSGYGEGGPVTNFVSSTLEEGLFISGINTENEQATYVRFDGGDYYDENGNSLKEVSITLNEPNTKLWIGGTAVTSDNAEDVFGDGKVSYDMTNQILSLNGVTIEEIVSNVGTLTINLTGSNSVNSISATGNATALAFTGDGTLTLENSDGVIYGFSSVDFGDFNLQSSVPGIHWSETRHALCNYEDDMAGEVTLTNEVVYPLWIAGVQVTSANASNVLGNQGTPTVVFDAENNTLTLNEVNLTVNDEDVIVSGLKNLTIFLVGENYITSYGNSSFAFNKSSVVDEATITFTTNAESNGSLTIAKQQNYLFGTGVTPVYTNVSIKSNGDSQTMDSSCGISVGGVDVTEFNKGNVFGDGKVSYNPTTHTLTLSNATIEPDEECAGIVYDNEKDLTIALIGNNSVKGGQGCYAIEKGEGVETPGLSFAKGDSDQHFSLTLTAESANNLIDGFDTTSTYDDLFVSDDEDDVTYTMTISSSIFGGTGSENEPFLIKTPDDLKMFSDYYNVGKYFSRNSHIKLNNDIDCKDLEGFTPFADNSDATFMGVFDGNEKTISNLTMTGMGLFGYVEKDGDYVGTIKDLTLSGLQLTGEEGEPVTGGIVTYLYEGAVVSNCTVVNSTIACVSNAYNPYVAAIVAQMSGATVIGCTVDNVQVKAETTYSVGSGPEGVAGGIVASASGGTISSCVVRNGTKITDYYADEAAALCAGAIVGKAYETTLSENYYNYDVNVEMLNGTDVTNKIVKSGYTQRAVGGTIQDVMDNNGAVMYTQTVTLPEETSQASVYGEENTYYSTTVISDASAYLVAPGQTVTLNAMPGEGYVVTGLTATNTTTEAPISTNSENLGDNITQYTFTMPDAPVTIALTAAQTIGIRVAGVEVTEVNAADVLSDGKVSFTAAVAATETTPAVPATLTLNNATINGCIYLYKDLEGGLTVYLQGQNTIDGGYVSSDENGDWAFGTSVEGAKLTITTDEANPGQLLIKNTYLNESENPEYYEGWYPAFANGLVESVNHGDKKVFIAQGPVMTPGTGIYWPDQQYTISGREGVDIKYKDNNGNFGETTYTGAFTISTVGRYNVNFWQEITIDETTFSPSMENSYFVYAKPTFSLASGSYAGTQNITLTNLPNNLPTGENSYPQVWYYLGENSNDSVRITDAQHEIEVTESTKVCVYILDEDTGKVVKSAPVEAQYTILDDIANAVVIGLADSVYTGEAIVPEFTVKASANAESNLTKGTDYEVSYKLDETTVESMINVATYTIVISGKGSYGGTKEMTFSITQATPTITFAQESYSAVLGEEFSSPATVDNNWDVTPWASSDEEVATVADGEITIVGVGTTLITVFYAGDENHLSTTASYQLVVSRALEVSFVGTNSWASYYATEDLTVPEGLTAYIVSGVNETSGVVTVQSVGYIPANNGVLLQREANGKADGYVAAPYDGTTSTFTNLLQGSASEVAVSSLASSPVYVLYNDKFKRATSGTIPARRAFLPLAVAPAGAPQLMTLSVIDGISTGISTLAADDNEDSWYTIDGLKLSGKPQHKGLYIKNGKKVFFNNK
jgi:hypothetical protein